MDASATTPVPAGAAAPNNASLPSNNADTKILADLETLSAKMDACDGILRPGGTLVESVPKTEATLEIIGFLEACAPRMVELVEAAAQGALSEPVLMKCLEVNDRLTKNLSDIDKISLVEAEESASLTATPSEDAFDAFLNDRTPGFDS